MTFAGSWSPAGGMELGGARHAVSGQPTTAAGEPVAPEGLHRAWTSDGLDAMRGDFAAALWDPDGRRGLLVRDQMGGRGLYYARRGEGLLFAAEVRDLLALVPGRPGVDEVSLAHWLTRYAVPPGRTLFEGVERLGPGEVIELTPDGWERRRWWSPRPIEGAEPEDVLAAIERAVERRSVEGRTGVLLSGGLDSSTVAAAAGRPLPAFSAAFPGVESADERGLIELLVRDLGAPWTVLDWQRAGAVRAGLDFLDQWHEPCPVVNFGLWQPLLAAARAEGIEVMLDGEGGDELFGPALYLLSDRLRRGRIVGVDRLARRLVGPAGRLGPLRRLALEGAIGPDVEAWVRARRPVVSDLQPRTEELYVESLVHGAWKRGSGPRWRRQHAWALTTRPAELGVFEYFQRSSASSGVDARHPLFDVDLIELILGLEPEQSFTAPTRPVQRRAMAGRVPDAIRLRGQKSTFTAPAAAALAGTEFAAVAELLGPGARLERYLQPKALAAVIAERPPPERWAVSHAWVNRAWRWSMAEAWLRERETPGFGTAMRDRLDVWSIGEIARPLLR